MIRSNVNPMSFPNLFTAGKAMLTFQNPQTGGHVTISVKQWKKRNSEGKFEKLPKFTIWISLLGDKERGMVMGGYFFQDENKWVLRKGVDQKSQLGRMMGFLKSSFENPNTIREKWAILLHEGKCCRCSLPLTNPASIDRGLGDDCYAYTTGAKKEKGKEPDLFS